MHALDIPQFLGLLVLLLGSAKLLGWLVQCLRQSVVLGELLAGVLVGASVLGLVDMTDQGDPRTLILDALGEIGVVVLLFEIGLETDLRQLIRLGATAATVAVVGVVLPFVLGYAVCHFLGLPNLESIVVGAALTATSVGITARVLADLGRLQEPESQIILGAALLDDILGLIILSVVDGVVQGRGITAWGVLDISARAFGFLAVTLVLGRWVVPPLIRLAGRFGRAGGLAMLALLLAFGLGWAAHAAGSAVIIGAFAAGLLLAATPRAEEIRHGVVQLGYFFVPLFFVTVGAKVDVHILNPFDPANARTLLVGGLLLVAAVAGKFLAGYAPFWFRGHKSVIGVGMIPRGEVGLIFAQTGVRSGVLTSGLFSAVTLIVMVTTFLAPPVLGWLFPPRPPNPQPPRSEGLEDLVSEA